MSSQSRDSACFRALQKRRLQLQTVPFLDDTIMDENSPPSCRVADFKVPRLRKCGFNVDSIDWARAEVLGAGLDGFVWRVNFGNNGPYALKMVGLPSCPIRSFQLSNS